MVEGLKGRVLAVDDSTLFRQMLEQVLKERGYTAFLAQNGMEALEMVQAEVPDIVLVDLTLPDIDGFEVCKRLRSDPSTQGIPILVLTSLEQPGFEVMAIDAGADDFISKPIDPLVLDARISMIVRRIRRERMANPLTGLPTSVPIDQEISARLARRQVTCLNYVDLDGFKHFNDEYGYDRGDDVLRMTAHILRMAVRDEGNKEDFIGQVGGDDFIYLTTSDKCEALEQRIRGDFDAAVPLLYDDDARKDGYFMATDRRGNEFKVPLLTLSIAMIDTGKKDFESSIEMLDAVTGLKTYAKSLEGSVYVTERRELRKPASSPKKGKPTAPPRGKGTSAGIVG